MTGIFETYVNAIRWLDNAKIGTATIKVDDDMSWFCLKTSQGASLLLLRQNFKYTHTIRAKDIISWAKNLNLDYRHLTEDVISIFIFEYFVE